MVRCVAILIGLVFSVGNALAAADPPVFSLAGLQTASQAVAAIRMPFIQTKRLAIFDEPVVTHGAIEIDRQLGALRWEFTGHSVTVLKDGRIRRWGAEGKEESGLDRDPGLRAMQSQMQALLTGDWRTVQDLFTVTLDPGGAPALTLVPKGEAVARYIARITLRFRADLSAPEALHLEAAGGDATDYAFSVPELVTAIAAERFTAP